MRYKVINFVAVFAVLFAVSATAEHKDTLAYRTFIDYANQGVVQSVLISEFGGNNMEAVILNDDAELTYYIDKPYQADADILFIEFLKEKEIPYKIYKRKFDQGQLWASLLPALIMFMLPTVVIVTLIIIVIVILRKVSRIERSINKLGESGGANGN